MVRHDVVSFEADCERKTMIDLKSAGTMLTYSDWANSEILNVSKRIGDEQMDQEFDMGRGSLRKTLLHILAGESVWLQRWQGRTETKWPDEEEKAPASEIMKRLAVNCSARSGFINGLKETDLAREVVYRDSKGSLFKATLADMILQGIIHSMHHRSQAVNMIRRLGGGLVELDYMTWVRRPA